MSPALVRINVPSQGSIPDPVNDVQWWLETSVQLLWSPGVPVVPEGCPSLT